MSLAALQRLCANTLDAAAARDDCALVGIIGDAPSRYAKSPSIWNPTFGVLGIPATYVAFDVTEERLPAVIEALRAVPRLAGFNVTVPYKIRILPLLDEVDERARRINAVNTVVRDVKGRLVGYNTDGEGFVDSIVRMPASDGRPLVPQLASTRVLLLGAGGAARAMAHYLVDAVAPATITIANRNAEAARALAKELDRVRAGSAVGVGEDDLVAVAPSVDLAVNATVKGQAGLRRLAGGQATCLEPYSALAPATPAELPEQGDAAAFQREWFLESAASIVENHRRSTAVVKALPAGAAFCDIVYAPLETVFLREGRLSGHRTLNGKGMNIAQAAIGFFRLVMRGELERRGLDTPETYGRIVAAMARVW